MHISKSLNGTKALPFRNCIAWNDSMQNILKATEKAVTTSALIASFLSNAAGMQNL